MNPMDSKVAPVVAVVVIVIAFAWIGCAYIMGAEAQSMILHPVVPILLILLLLKARKDDSVRYVTTIAIAFASIWLFVRLQSVFMPFILGFSLAYVVYVALAGLQNIPIPLPRRKRFHLPKAAAIAVLVILIVGFIVFLAVGIVPQLVNQANKMQEGIGSMYTRVRDYMENMLLDVERGEYPLKDRLPESWQPIIETAIVKMSPYIQEKIPELGSLALEKFRELLDLLREGLGRTMGQVSSAFFVFIIFVYAVQSFHSHMERLNKLIPEAQRERIARYLGEIDRNMRAFLRGQLTVIVIISIISIIAYSLIGIPLALLVGLLAGLCNAIPTIGPIIGGGIAVLASIVGVAAGDYAVTGFLIRLVLVLGVSFAIQLLDNSLISPKIMSTAIEVHPLVIIFAVLLSASLVGIWGAVLAIPGIVVVKGVLKASNEMRAERAACEMGIEPGQ